MGLTGSSLSSFSAIDGVSLRQLLGSVPVFSPLTGKLAPVNVKPNTVRFIPRFTKYIPVITILR